jgi:hypothetical protein
MIRSTKYEASLLAASPTVTSCPVIEAAIGYVTNAWNRFCKGFNFPRPGNSTRLYTLLRILSQNFRANEAINSQHIKRIAVYVRSPACLFCFWKMTVQAILRWRRTRKSDLFWRCWHSVVKNVRLTIKVSPQRTHKTHLLSETFYFKGTVLLSFVHCMEF